MTPAPLPTEEKPLPTSSAAPDLSIVVVTHDGMDLALETLESAMARIGEISVEWVILDSGSTDGTPEAIETARWPQIEVVRLPNVGFAAANNVGFEAARGRYLLALNPDTVVRWGRFGAVVEAMDARPEVGAASVIQEEADRKPAGAFAAIQPSCELFGEALVLRKLPGLQHVQERELDQGAYAQERQADWLVGAVLFLRREALASSACRSTTCLRRGGPLPQDSRRRLGSPTSARHAHPPLRGQAESAARRAAILFRACSTWPSISDGRGRCCTAACWPCIISYDSWAWPCVPLGAIGGLSNCGPSA